MHNGDIWKTASEISMHFMWAKKMSKAMVKLNLMPWKHQQSMKSSPKRFQDHALDVVDPTSEIYAQSSQMNLIIDP